MISLEVKSFSLFADTEKKHLLFKTNKTVFSVGVLQLITGPSGSGKTSFLNALAGANKQFDGQLSFVEDGHRNLPWENSFSYVTVDNCCLPELSVEDHLSFVTGDKEKIREYLQMLGLWEIRKRKLSLCSKGERVRTEIATSLCRSSSLILLDEPTANLDNENKCLVFQALMTIAKTRIVIVVTHDCDPEILNKSNVFRIENQTLVKLPSSPIQPLNEMVSPSKNAEKEKGSHSFLPIIKLSAAAALKHKMQFFFSVFFLIVSLMGSFLFVGFKGINEEESLLTATPKMPSQENEVVCKDTSLSLPQVGKEGFHFTKMAMSSPLDGQYLNLACAEDLTPDLSANVLSLLNNANVSQANDSASPCYPIVITSEFDNYLSAKEGHSFGIQDSLPVSLSQCVYAIPHERRKSQFIIAGIIDKISDIQDFTPDRGFPAILRKKDYLCCLEDSGIRDSSFTDSLQALLTQYQTYCEQEKLTCPQTLQIPLQLTSLLRVSDFSSDAICSTNPATKEDGKLYYQGSLPMAENEILIPEDQSISSYAALKFIYSTGREQESDHSFFDPYQKEKQYHLPLAENAFSNFGLSLGDSFIVSGSFVLNSSTRNLKDCVLISDSLFGKGRSG
jgi:ABC-type multidrug transport system ATPase subunit